MSELTIEQRREQIRIQQEAIAAEEAELRRKEREAEETARAKRHEEKLVAKRAAQEVVIEQIRAAIMVARPSLEFTIDHTAFRTASGEGQYYDYVTITAKTEGDRWSPREVPGAFDITVGDYGDKHRFPSKKDKTNSYDKVAAHLLSRYDISEAKRKRDAVVRNNAEASAPTALALREQFGLHEYGSVSVRPSASAGLVNVKLPELISLTPEKATELLTMLKQVGLIK